MEQRRERDVRVDVPRARRPSRTSRGAERHARSRASARWPRRTAAPSAPKSTLPESPSLAPARGQPPRRLQEDASPLRAAVVDREGGERLPGRDRREPPLREGLGPPGFPRSASRPRRSSRCTTRASYFWHVRTVRKGSRTLFSEWSAERRFKVARADQAAVQGEAPPARPRDHAAAERRGLLGRPRGTHRPRSTVTVNGETTDVNADGSFRKIITMGGDGMQTIVIKARARAGGETIKRETVLISRTDRRRPPAPKGISPWPFAPSSRSSRPTSRSTSARRTRSCSPKAAASSSASPPSWPSTRSPTRSRPSAAPPRTCSAARPATSSRSGR